MNAKSWIILVAAIVVVAALVRSLVFVDETEVVIITQFGRPVRTLETAGLALKAPYQSAWRVDRRLQLYNPLPAEFLTSEKKNLDLEVFVAWRVADAEKFLQSVTDFTGAQVRIHDVVFSELAAAVGKTSLDTIVTTEAEQHQLDPLLERVGQQSRDSLLGATGVEIVDVRLKRISLPTQVRESVFLRMRAERARMARRYRAEGDEEALKIRAEADKQKTITLADAYAVAEQTRGKAEAEATKIYAQAHAIDPEFYELTRSLEAYKKFLDEKTTILLSSESELLKYLTQGAKPK
jgi:modulator of FtsH protease HflC